jgi:two-component system cell cycle sensor histidine kinase/response regulator CckA
VSGAIDLVLTDVIMPDMAGPAMVGQLLEKWPGIRIMYMSGYAQNDKIRAEMADRETSFLQKPFSADSLLLTVREVLDQAIRLDN